MKHSKASGFTLIELMIVVAIIGILAGMAIPKFADLIVKANEANTKGNLGAIRSALSIYYSDVEGSYPTDALASLTANAKYLATMPIAKFPANKGTNAGHPDSIGVTQTSTVNSDVGGWAYDSSRTDANWGRVLANCTHSDAKGTVWTSY